VQFATESPPAFGLGFIVGQWRGRRLINHNGAIYGCSALLYILPEEKLAAVVLANEDIVNGRTRHIAEAGLSQLLEAKLGEKPPQTQSFAAPPNLAALAGDYESQSFWARLEARDGQLTGEISGQRVMFAPAGGLNFTAHSRMDDATPVAFKLDGGGFTLGPQQFERVPSGRPPLPPEWRACCGSYGPDFIPVIVSERHGRLYAMTENMYDYRLAPLNLNACALPPGLYTDEQAVFITEAGGRPRAVNFANMILPRRTST
jgi:CubicO group peptidase (beta-lactamase class C family)